MCLVLVQDCMEYQVSILYYVTRNNLINNMSQTVKSVSRIYCLIKYVKA